MRRVWFGAAVIALLLASGCGGGDSSSSSPAAGSRSPAAAGADTYSNPVYTGDFPDPGVVRVGSTYWAFGTNGNGANVQVLTSTDLVSWKSHPDALPTLPSWATSGNTWAPEVVHTAGGYQMYFVAHSQQLGVQCVGHASSATPGGPYVDHAARPLVCQTDMGGSIDPDPFVDGSGKLYLAWKNDGNCCNKPVWLWSQRLSEDGSALVGSPAKLLTNTKSWQGDLVEAPEMVHHGSAWFLFYSANGYASDNYAIGYARCQGPLGPCHDASDKPLVSTTDDAAGPGHCFIVTTPSGATWLLFHAWPPDAIGAVLPGRQLWLEPLHWNGDTPSVPPPTTAPQPLPSVAPA